MMKKTDIKKLKNDIWGYCFVAPTIILFVLFTLIPIVMSIGLSFTNFKGISFDTMTWRGLDNYIYIFKSDKYFWRGMRNIGIFVLATVPVTLTLSMLLALLIKKNLPATKLFRGLFYVPGITSVVASSTVFRYLFNGNGIFNNLIKQINSAFGTNFDMILVNSQSTALGIIIVMAWWGSLGGNMILFLASMQGIPQTVFEAAKIDGASKSRTFFSVTLPLMRPAIYFALTLALIGAPQMFEPILIMDAATTTPVFSVYNNAVKGTAVGLGTAQASILFVIIMIVTFGMQKLNKETYN